MNNLESEQFNRLCDDIHRIANQIAPEETQDNTINSMLSGAFQGCAIALQKVLDGGHNEFVKSSKLRELVERWSKLADEYSRRQEAINESNKRNQHTG